MPSGAISAEQRLALVDDFTITLPINFLSAILMAGVTRKLKEDAASRLALTGRELVRIMLVPVHLTRSKASFDSVPTTLRSERPPFERLDPNTPLER